MLSARLAREAQSAAHCVLRCRPRLHAELTRRAISTTPAHFSAATSPNSASAPSPLPWFVDPAEEDHAPSPYARRVATPQTPARPLAPLPAAITPDHPIARLHAELKASPHLEPGTLLVREPIPTATGPPLPPAAPKGRRRRGGTNAGQGVNEDLGGIWQWVVIAQVKEGTENRGAIESVIRIVRKALLTADPPLPLPPNSKRRVNGGWAMIDAGDFAIHILSKEAREKYFPERREW
ncbi:hypothetical protein C8Q70DRAFT_1058178 [Cubamyces menziesii]|uniref:Uncharacterized protein n=1 Tax=Trametes cubensis TaxID=1111947 RepID=A0AAD7TSB5_9APHY|nr:hypothetical protein C8Q70DRAFT_1058178 [Cubamyces menziesii]KAJ8480921.1 hypothetical protein ONZ51_g6331 [Trametes cubensis]